MDESFGKIKIVFFVFIFLLLLVFLFYGLYYLLFTSRTPQPSKTNVFNNQDLETVKLPLNTPIDYDQAYNPTTPINDITGLKDDLLNPLITNSLLTIPQIDVSDLDRIIIPQLNINSSINSDSDGEVALTKGFWLYPASSAFDGEKILFCHRRYWGQKNPNSCWFLDRLSKGSTIQTVDKSGKLRQYSVVSVNQLEGNDPGIITISNEDVIKLVTCTPLGFSTHRLIVIANRV